MSDSVLCHVCMEVYTSDVLEIDDINGNPVSFPCCHRCSVQTMQSLQYQRDEMREILGVDRPNKLPPVPPTLPEQTEFDRLMELIKESKGETA